MAADKCLGVYPGIINNTCGSETWVILYWSLLHLSSCEFKNGAQLSLLSNNKDGSPSLGGFGNYILTGANWESFVRTVFLWKMYVVRHWNFMWKKLSIFPSLPSGMTGGRDPWLTARKVQASAEQWNSGAILEWGCTATTSLPAPLSSISGSQALGKGKSRKTQDFVAQPYGSYKELLSNSLSP